MRKSQITNWCHEIFLSQVKKEGIYVDATMGNGNDTLLLRRMAGENGHVYAFDIQEQAIEATKARLVKEGLLDDQVELILDGHEHMDQYVKEEGVDLICFNFGYLPGGDHDLGTKLDTDIEAIQIALQLLNKDGLLSLCIYSGGDTGFEEKEGILEFLKTLPSREYTVIVNQYHNRVNNPPMPVFVWKEV